MLVETGRGEWCQPKDPGWSQAKDSVLILPVKLRGCSTLPLPTACLDRSSTSTDVKNQWKDQEVADYSTDVWEELRWEDKMFLAVVPL